MTESARALELRPEEQQLLREEAEALVAAADPQRRPAFAQLAADIEAGVVPGEHEDTLASLLAMLLETGRARRRYTAEGERILTELWRRTARGRELEEMLGRANRALAALAGQRLRAVRVGMRTVGHYTVTIECETVSVVLAVRPGEVAIESLSA